jgi:Trypsin-like peptidase domain
MINTNILTRVVRIKCGNNTGSAFTIEKDNKQFLVTAKHVVSQFSGSIEIFHEQVWKTARPTWLKTTNEDADVAVMHFTFDISPRYNLPTTCAEIILSQNVYFLGFPFGLSGNTEKINNHFPLPFVKCGILSALLTEQNGNLIFLVDGHNNKGFSGGPLVYYKNGNPALELRVCGVISAYKSEEKQVMHNGVNTGLTVGENTGIVVAHDIKNALNLIDEK